jgi:TolB-like protein
VLKERRKAVLEPVVKEHGGRIVKVMGDGVLVEFASAVGAVEAALRLQENMEAANAGLPEAQRIVLRVGVNLGDVIREGTDIYGEGVNIAARLEALAEPGSICISGKVHEETRGKLDVGFEDMGEQHLKNLARPVRVYRLIPVSLGGRAEGGARAAGGRDQTSIAVLPFVNMSGNAEQDYFADGLTEDLITELSRYRHLAVTARNTTFLYEGRSVNVPEVARELGVDFVVEGSVRQSGTRVRITVQLIDGETGAHVWAEKFDRSMEDIFAMQDEVVTSMLARLSFNLDEAAGEQRQRSPTASVTAYTNFLRARAAWRNGDERAAYGLLMEAVRLDPTYARALSHLAFFLAYSRFSHATGLPDEEASREALDLTRRAVAVDSGDSFTLHRAAMTYLMLGEPETARRYIDVAASHSPRDLEIMNVRGLILAFCGRHQEGIAQMQRAIQFEPRLPPGFHAALSDGFYLAHDYEGSLAALEKIVDPPHYVRLCQAASLAQLGRIEQARRIVGELPKAFDLVRFARNCAAICLLPEDAEHWLEGFRKAGVAV